MKERWDHRFENMMLVLNNLFLYVSLLSDALKSIVTILPTLGYTQTEPL